MGHSTSVQHENHDSHHDHAQIGGFEPWQVGFGILSIIGLLGTVLYFGYQEKPTEDMFSKFNRTTSSEHIAPSSGGFLDFIDGISNSKSDSSSTGNGNTEDESQNLETTLTTARKKE